MKRKKTFLIIVGVVLLIIIFVSWIIFPGWRDMKFGFYYLILAVLGGVVPIISGIVSIWNDLYGSNKHEKNVIKGVGKIRGSSVIQIADSEHIGTIIGQQNITIYETEEEKLNKESDTQHNVDIVDKKKIPSSHFELLPDYYVVRENLFQKVKEKMGIGKRATKPAKHIVIQGMAGTGKSMLIRGLLEEPSVQENYPDGTLTAFLGPSTNGEKNLEKTLINWIRIFHDEPKEFPTIDGKVEYLRNLISRKRMLIVVDDVWDAESISDLLKIVGHGSTLVITTRSRELAPRLGINKIVVVDKLTENEARELVANRLGNQPEKSEWDHLINKFCHFVHWHALAISLASAQVSVGDIGWEGILDEFEKEQGIKNIDFDDPKTREESVSLTLQLSINTLKDTDKRRYAWLGVFAPGVPFYIEDAASIFPDFNENDNDRKVDFSTGSLEEYTKKLTDLQIKDLRQTFSRFYRKGLVDLEILQNEHLSISLHPLLHDYCVFMLKDMGELKEAFSHQAAVYLISLALISGRETGIDYWHQHGELALNRAWQSIKNPSNELISGSDIFLIGSITYLGKYWIRRGEYDKAIDWIRRILLLDSDKSSDSVLELKLILSSAHIELGQYEIAKTILDELAEMDLRDSDRVTLLNSWGEYHLNKKNKKEAIDIIEELVDLTQKVEDRETEGMAYGNLGIAYLLNEMPEEAIEAFKLALKIGEEIKDSRGIGKRMGNLAMAHHMMASKNLRIAARLNKESLDAARYYGDIKSQGIHTFILAQISMQLGRFELARVCAEEAKELFESIGSPNSKGADLLLGRLDGTIKDRNEFIPPHKLLEYTEAACNGDRISEFYLKEYFSAVEQNNELVTNDVLRLIRSLMLILSGERDIEKVTKGLTEENIFSVKLLLLRLNDPDQAKFFDGWSMMMMMVLEKDTGAIDVVKKYISYLKMDNNLPNYITSEHIRSLESLIAGERNPDIVSRGLNEFYVYATRNIISQGGKPNPTKDLLAEISAYS